MDGAVADQEAKLLEAEKEVAGREQNCNNAPLKGARKLQEKIQESKDVAASHKEAYLLLGEKKNQLAQIKEVTDRVLSEDTHLSERLKNLFREKGVTIASALTALSLLT